MRAAQYIANVCGGELPDYSRSQDEIDRLKAAVGEAQRQADESKADVSTAMGKVSELDNRAAALKKAAAQTGAALGYPADV